MGEPVDPTYHPPLPFTPPEQRTDAQSQPGYPGGYPPPAYAGGYPPPQYAPSQYPPVPWTPPPPSHRRRNVIIAVAVVAVLALAGVGVYALTDTSSDQHRLAIPQSFGGYTQEHDATSDRVQSMMRGMLSGLGSDAKHVMDAASIGLYAADSDVSQKALVLALPTSAVTGGGSADEFADEMLQYMGTGVSPYPPGPHGGSMRCGQTSIGVTSESGCSWSDDSTTGLIVSVHQGGAPLTPQQLSAVTLALRDRIH